VVASAAGSLVGFALIGWLARQPWFWEAFGFTQDGAALPLLLFGLLSGVAAFWLSPLLNLWSRRFEYQADRYAATATGDVASFIGALRKLAGKNLSNLTPHPWYSGFYYSHPTLLDREQALVTGSARQMATVGRSSPVQSDPV
jgi:STE24 endopeptidase